MLVLAIKLSKNKKTDTTSISEETTTPNHTRPNLNTNINRGTRRNDWVQSCTFKTK